MQRELESLVRKLDRRIGVDWVEEMRLGKPAYDHLLASVGGGRLTRNQTANALHALFRLRMNGNEEALFALLLSHSSHSERRVRSEAVKLLIGMMKLHELQPPFQPSACVDQFRAATALGLDHDIASLVKDFIARHGV